MNVNPNVSIYKPTDYSSLSPLQLKQSDEEFIRRIQFFIKSDPFCSNQGLNLDLLQLLKAFIQHGSPILRIPQVATNWCVDSDGVVTSCFFDPIFDYENLTLCEFIFRLRDVLGLEIFESCLEKVHQLVQKPDLNLQEIISIMECLVSCDPYLGENTGSSFLKLIDKFLENKGNPLHSISNDLMNFQLSN
jgi:hypothetical protein